MPRKNIIGRQIAFWRYQMKWTQKMLEARLQCQGFNVTREMLANIEVGLRGAHDNWLIGLQKVFRLPIIRFFPKEIQDFDAELARRNPAPSSAPAPSRKKKRPRRKCKKLTKRRKGV